jgi:hypothetical protein
MECYVAVGPNLMTFRLQPYNILQSSHPVLRENVSKLSAVSKGKFRNLTYLD